MKNIIISLIIGVVLGGIGAFVFIDDKNEAIGGIAGMGFYQTATSGVIAVTSDVQILSTTTQRALATICNDSAQVVYLSLNQDIALLADGSNKGHRLNANGGCLEINTDNNGDIYWGAIRASSTNETSSNLIINEYKFR